MMMMMSMLLSRWWWESLLPIPATLACSDAVRQLRMYPMALCLECVQDTEHPHKMSSSEDHITPQSTLLQYSYSS